MGQETNVLRKCHNFAKKTMSKVVSWILIMVMLVTLPQMLSAATMEVKAENSYTVTVHFNNSKNWENVYSMFAEGDSWTPISGYEAAKERSNGMIVSENENNDNWYSFSVSKVTEDTLHGNFNAGSWGDELQTDNYSISFPEGATSTEVWITFAGDTGKTIQTSTTAPEGWIAGGIGALTDPNDLAPDFQSTIIDADSQEVTFQYYDTTSERVRLAGSMTSWGTDAIELTKGADSIWSVTTALTPGVYEYKFILGDATWITDPKNETKINGNSKVVMPGLAAPSIAPEAVVGETLDLPDTLNLYSEDGNSEAVQVSYCLQDEELSNKVVINDNSIIVSDDTLKHVTFIASYTDENQKVYLADIDVNVVAKMYTYNIYYYDADYGTVKDSALWIFNDPGLTGAQYDFSGTEIINGITWLKTTVTTSVKNLSIIPKAYADWSWQDSTRTYENSTEAETTNLYMIRCDETNIYTEAPTSIDIEKRYIEIEYNRTDSDYDGWNVFTWNSGYGSSVSVDFEEINGKMIAKVPVVKSDADKVLSFCMRKSTTANAWAEKDGGDHYVNIASNQMVVKAKFVQGSGIVEVLPDNIGYDMDGANDTIHFYYRDDDLYEACDLDSLEGQVSIVIDGTEYPMTYDTVNERYYYDMTNLTSKDYTYYYKVNNNIILDTFNPNTVVKDEVTCNVCTYHSYDMAISAKMSSATMNYNQNDVLSVTTNFQAGEDSLQFAVKSAYCDLTVLGGEAKATIDTKLLELTISTDYSTAIGDYLIPVTVVDIYGNVYKTTVAVEITKRVKDSNQDGEEDDFDWDEAVVYFAVTDRFFDGDETNNDAYGLGDYNTDENTGSLSYHGGDFAGMTEKLDYLKDLGVNTIWITPIVENYCEGLVTSDATITSYGYHGYWATDFTKLNKHLGTEEQFSELISAAHERGMKIMVDVVINHSGYDTEDYFNNIIQDSDGNSINMIRDEEQTVEGDDVYDSLAGLPDFVTEDVEVRDQLVEWQVDWVEKYDIDYYRVDTVKHVDSTTWSAFKNELTKVNQNFKLIGEYSGAGYANTAGELGTGTMDALLDFDFNDQAQNFVTGSISSVETFLENRNESISSDATLGSFLSSHDEDGLLYKLMDEEGSNLDEKTAYNLFKVAASLELTAKGIPVIYYGEELGQTGADDYPDQTNRYNYDWSSANDDNAMLTHYKTLLSIRNKYTDVFARGNRESVAVSDENGYEIVSRTYSDETVLVGLNISDTAQNVDISVDEYPGSIYTDEYNNCTYTVSSNKTITVNIPAASKGGTAILALSNSAEAVTGVTLNQTAITVEKNATTTLQETVLPSNAGNKNVTWISSDTNIATVSNTGVVKGIKAGTAMITVQTADGNKTATCAVTVKAAATNINLNKTVITISVKKSYTLKATITPSDSTDTITWSSSKKSVATVSSTGKVKGIKAGTVTITATTSSGKKVTCKVTVNVPATSIVVSSKENIKVGKKKTLTATVLPSNTTDKVTWSTSNKKVVTVNSKGKIKGIKIGTATITATTASGKKATCKVTVLKHLVEATSIKMNHSKVTIKKGKKYTLKATVAPSNTTDFITWKSSNKKVATVSTKGKVKAIKKGTAIITATTASGKKITCKITVK